MTDKTYVHEGCEVVMTGRRASKEMRNNKTQELVEIKPAEQGVPSFKKWVREKDLFEVIEDGH